MIVLSVLLASSKRTMFAHQQKKNAINNIRFFASNSNFVCQLQDVGFHLPNGTRIFDNVNLSFLKGAKIGMLGANGCGKSTLMKIIAGVHTEFDGTRWTQPGVKIGYLRQEPELDPSKNVRENIMDGLKESQDLLDEFTNVSNAMGEPDADFDTLLESQSKLQEAIDAADCWDLSYEVDRAMRALRVPPGDSDVSVLSGGERRRVALCRLLLEKPDMLLLDEPSNHLDATSVRWLEQFLQSYKGTVIAITHDRYFLDNVAGWILEIERGVAMPYEGNYSGWLDAKSNRMNMENKKDAARASNYKKELEWIRSHQGNKKGSKARISKMNSSEKNSSNVNHEVLEGQIIIPPGPRLGNKVLEAKNLSKSFDGRTLFKDLSFEVGKNAIVGIIGGNGVGKSTLCDILSGKQGCDDEGGLVTLGSSVSMGHVSQSRAELNDKNTLFQEVSNGLEYVTIGNREVHVRAYLASFNFKGPTQEKRIAALSGGERNRLQLAKALLAGHNVIVLDEPTNDLDVETLRSLEQALVEFDGSAFIISHDRWFLDRICTHILSFEDDDKGVVFFEGNYSAYIAQ